jgi:tetratricopeptide (TPR) repeat protein
MRYLRDYPTVANWRIIIINYRNTLPREGGDRFARINLYRMLRGTGALADTNDYFEYAQSAQLAGLPWEAIAVIDEGRKSGKVPTGEVDFNRVYTASKTAVTNEGSLETIAKAAKTGKDFSAIADAFLASGNNARALELYDVALTKGDANANAVNLHRGVALVNLNRKDEAKTAFGAVTGAGSLTDIAKFWLVWLELPALT